MRKSRVEDSTMRRKRKKRKLAIVFAMVSKSLELRKCFPREFCKCFPLFLFLKNDRIINWKNWKIQQRSLWSHLELERGVRYTLIEWILKANSRTCNWCRCCSVGWEGELQFRSIYRIKASSVAFWVSLGDHSTVKRLSAGIGLLARSEPTVAVLLLLFEVDTTSCFLSYPWHSDIFLDLKTPDSSWVCARK